MTEARFESWFEPKLWQAMASQHPGSPQYVEYDDFKFSYYRLPVNLLSYFSVGKYRPKLIYPIDVMGLPLSVSHGGFYAPKGAQAETMLQALSNTFLKPPKKGLQVLFNMPHDETLHHGFTRMGLIPMETLPTAVLRHAFDTFDGYLMALRAPYRYRIQKVLAHLDAHLVRKEVAPEQFDPGLYRLYEAVYEHSAYPLEKASLKYFQRFPASLVALYTSSGEALGFYQYIVVDQCFYFVFCGLDYTALHAHKTYSTLLADLLRTAINLGCKHIDFGQTTELMKLKLGFKIESRRLYVRHANPLLHWCIAKLSSRVDYHLPEMPELHVFRS